MSASAAADPLTSVQVCEAASHCHLRLDTPGCTDQSVVNDVANSVL